MTVIIKCFVGLLYNYKVEIKILVLSRFLSAMIQKGQRKIKNGCCHLVRLGIYQNSVLMTILSTKPWRSDTFKGGVLTGTYLDKACTSYCTVLISCQIYLFTIQTRQESDKHRQFVDLFMRLLYIQD